MMELFSPYRYGWLLFVNSCNLLIGLINENAEIAAKNVLVFPFI